MNLLHIKCMLNIRKRIVMLTSPLALLYIQKELHHQLMELFDKSCAGLLDFHALVQSITFCQAKIQIFIATWGQQFSNTEKNACILLQLNTTTAVCLIGQVQVVQLLGVHKLIERIYLDSR